MQTRPGFFRRHLRTIGALVFVSLYSVSISFATPPTTQYQPGATLDPACTPGSTNCSVQILPDQTGNANRILSTNGSVTAWANTLSGTDITFSNIPNSALTNSSISINGSPVALGGSVSNLALTTNPLSQFASTTSSQLAGVLSDETGTGTVVYSASPTLTGTTLATNLTVSGAFINTTATPAVFANSGAQNYNRIELRGGSGGTAVNWAIEKDNTTANALQITPSTTNGGTTYTTPVLTVQSNGNVGVGTNAPGARLGVSTAGSIMASFNSTGTYGGYVQLTTNDVAYGYIGTVATLNGVGATADLGIRFENQFFLMNGTTSRLTIDSSGNIVIPDLAGSGNRCVYADSTGQLNVKGFDCGSASGGDNLGDHTATQNVILGTNWLSGDGGSEGIRIDGSGNVGVGTGSPTTKLEVVGTDTIARINGSVRAQLRLVTTTQPGWQIEMSESDGNQLAGDLGIVESGVATRFVIREGGNVGIGTTTPSEKLVVYGNTVKPVIGNATAHTVLYSGYDSQTNTALEINNTSTVGNGNPSLVLSQNTTTSGGYLGGITFANAGTAATEKRGAIIASALEASAASTITANLEFYTSSAGALAERMRITSGGNVGINESSPDSSFGLTVSNPTNVSVNSLYLKRKNENQGTRFYTGSGDTIIDSYNGNSSYIPTFIFRSTNNSTSYDRMVIDTNGNVGIGTTSPSKMFHVSKNAQVEARFEDTSSSSYFTITQGSNSYLTAKNSLWLSANDTLGTGMVILPSGNVGIGATSPSQKLEIGSGNIMLGRIGTALQDTRYIGLGAANGTISVGTSGGSQIGFTNSALGDNTIEFITHEWGVSHGVRMMIDRSGKVGIGTTSPVAMLSVNAGTSAYGYTKGLLISYGGSDASGGLSLWHDDGGQTAEYIDSRYDSAAAAINFRMRVKGTPVNAMTILGSGSIGIGTASPVSKLTVQDGAISIGDTSQGSNSTFAYSGGQTRFSMDSAGTGGYAFRTYSGSYADRMVILSNGNVGIATTTPTQKLEVNGTGLFTGTSLSGNTANGVYILDQSIYSLAGSGARDLSIQAQNLTFYTGTTYTLRVTINTSGNLRLHAYGAGTLTTDSSGNVTASSDERLKDIEGEFETGLSALRLITPIMYRWNAQSGMEMTDVYAGFSAQNIQDAIPEAVGIDPRGYLTLSDRPLLAAAINAIKELDIKVQSLPDFADQSLAVKVAAFLQGIAEDIARIGTVQTDTLCIGATCVTEAQLQQLLTQSGQANAGGSSGGETPEPAPAPEEGVEEPQPEGAGEPTPAPEESPSEDAPAEEPAPQELPL